MRLSYPHSLNRIKKGLAREGAKPVSLNLKYLNSVNYLFYYSESFCSASFIIAYIRIICYVSVSGDELISIFWAIEPVEVSLFAFFSLATEVEVFFAFNADESIILNFS